MSNVQMNVLLAAYRSLDAARRDYGALERRAGEPEIGRGRRPLTRERLYSWA